MNILVDIGGTYARFAVEQNGKPDRIKKYAAADYKTFDDALVAYCKEAGVQKSKLLISTAAHPDGTVWKFVNKNKWEIDTKKIAVEIMLNDFEAATWGLKGAACKNLKAAKGASASLCLIGPGTGLGLGYLHEGKYVQGTMGGHIAVAAVTAEQSLVLQTVQHVKTRSGLVVYEDLVSGPALLNIYRALYDIDGIKATAESAGQLLDEADTPQVKTTLRLFHEFFALFAASVVVSGNAFGGLYLTGGIVDRLAEKNLFDFAHFEKFFVGDYVPSIKKALDETPVYHVTDPYLALQGLINAKSLSHD